MQIAVAACTIMCCMGGSSHNCYHCILHDMGKMPLPSGISRSLWPQWLIIHAPNKPQMKERSLHGSRASGINQATRAHAWCFQLWSSFKNTSITDKTTLKTLPKTPVNTQLDANLGLPKLTQLASAHHSSHRNHSL